MAALAIPSIEIFENFAEVIGIPSYDISLVHAGYLFVTDDVDMEDQLQAKVVWSEYPHARVTKVDTSQAEALPGVVRVLTAKDVPVNEYGIIVQDQPVLVGVGDKVRWLGDRILENAHQTARDVVDFQADFAWGGQVVAERGSGIERIRIVLRQPQSS